MTRSSDDQPRAAGAPADPDGGAGFDLRGLPDRVKGLGLPPEAVAALDRYWAPAWLAEPGITAERPADAFLEPPLYSTSHAGGFGTIYTAAHVPDEGSVQYRWPGVVWDQSFEHFEERTHVQAFAEGDVVR